jgi:adenine deaminase
MRQWCFAPTRCAKSGGGIAIADRGAILENIELPFGGIFSDKP